MSPEDLIGYLLGALEPDEIRRVEQALAMDADLRAELERLRQAMQPLAELKEEYEPPAGLVDRAMANLGANPREEGVGEGLGDVRLAGGHELLPAREWSWRDIFAGSIAVLVIVGLVFPSILRERAAARVVACQNQLRQAGIALAEYMTRTEERRFPQLELEGPEAFSGRYAIELYEAGLLSSDNPLWCPSQEVPGHWVGRPLPNRAELHRVGPLQLEFLQAGSGGHYAYSLGIRERGRYGAPRFQSRPYFAILADAPTYRRDGEQLKLMSLSANKTSHVVSLIDHFWGSMRRLVALPLSDGQSGPHEGRGFNLLYEDGHVAFVPVGHDFGLGDHPFVNRVGRVEAGLDPDDAALAPSVMPPFSWIRNR
jgi:hypothetical protein